MPAPRNLKAKIIELRQKGKSYRFIEKELNCSKRTINYHCNNFNLTDLGKKLYPLNDELKLSISKFCKSKSIKEAMDYFKLSKSTIHKYKNFELKNDDKEKTKTES